MRYVLSYYAVVMVATGVSLAATGRFAEAVAFALVGVVALLLRLAVSRPPDWVPGA